LKSNAVSSTAVHPVLFHIGPLLIPSYGALAAAGVLLALLLGQRTASVVGIAPAHAWNVCVIALFAALLGSRLLLVVVNWRDLLRHPLWMLGLATIHHPLLAAAGATVGAIAALGYTRWQHLPLRRMLDALVPPLTLGLACEQVGALLAGSGYGAETAVRWSVIYTSPLAARWSGTPLFVPLHPVQAYAALAYLTLAIFLLVFLPVRRQEGDVAGIGLLGIGVSLFITEFWRDREGRGAVMHGFLDGPQIVAIVLVLLGAVLLRERKVRSLAVSNEVAHG
jgi:phosphatidylglycerol:prolipoprotein diacylglycerol transferase